MKFRYKNKQIKINLIFGIVWFVYGIIKVVITDKLIWIDYGWFAFSILYLIIYFYQKKEKYLTIENGIIKQNWPFGKQLNLTEIKSIKYFAGDLILKTENNELIINRQLIEENSLKDLEFELKKLNLNWD
ncbi:hypothetical protein [Gillisia hiemivivida]|uniref:Uncharacterized protein n=1 Tax=Gillisia hiemivivida TaxID=291190 RepID=A0A5C6ZNP6_9FLAO|nr:hypothetical protein [Gillisia hiemivivida]TXD91684.1 hypothetical protein ES724_16225 [Gillisia hiemivivida]